MAPIARDRPGDARIAGFAVTAEPDGGVQVVAADETGLTGAGAGPGVRDDVFAWCRRLVETPLFAETQRWTTCFSTPDQARGAALAEFGIVEAALADLAARRLGVPLHDWLGGKVRDAIDVVVPAWSPSRSPADAVLIASEGGWQDALAAARRVREADGSARRIAVDLDCRLAAADRAAFAAAADPLTLDLVIDPDTIVDVASASPLRLRAPVAARVALAGLGDLARALERGLFQALVVDPVRWGGPPGVRRVAALARVFQASLYLDARGSAAAHALAAHLALAFPTVAGVIAERAPLTLAPGPALGLAAAMPAGSLQIIGTVPR